jgi:hypothetical protein
MLKCGRYAWMQVESMSVLVGQLAGDVRGMMARMDAMSSQVMSDFE